MVNQAEFKSLIDMIVQKNMPSEVATYETFKDEIVDAAYSERDPSGTGDEAGQFEFGESILIGMKIFGLQDG